MTFRENVPYLNEVIGGSHGIEFRYPYYDKRLWQETFYLDKKICINKNKNHKPPLHSYLEKCNFFKKLLPNSLYKFIKTVPSETACLSKSL